jgi:hypothetical protein
MWSFFRLAKATHAAAEDYLQPWPVSKRVNSSRASDRHPMLIDRGNSHQIARPWHLDEL